MTAELPGRVRQKAGLSQEDLATRAGTSRTTLPAYERGQKSPTVAAMSRLLDTAGFQADGRPQVAFTEHALRRGRPTFVADRLWRSRSTRRSTT